MTIVAELIVLAFAIYFARPWIQEYKIRSSGQEVEAVVSRLEKNVYTDREALLHPITYFYVIFMKENGMENEARLLNPDPDLLVGNKVTVRYLPGKEQVAVLTSISEE